MLTTFVPYDISEYGVVAVSDSNIFRNDLPLNTGQNMGRETNQEEFVEACGKYLASASRKRTLIQG